MVVEDGYEGIFKKIRYKHKGEEEYKVVHPT